MGRQTHAGAPGGGRPLKSAIKKPASIVAGGLWDIAGPQGTFLAGAAFAAIHVGYIGSDGLGVVWPLVGTATLGAVLALSVIRGKGSLLPAVTAHALIILIVQPWLALAT